MLVSHSEFGYQLLPYLRAHFPEPAAARFLSHRRRGMEERRLSAPVGDLSGYA